MTERLSGSMIICSMIIVAIASAAAIISVPISPTSAQAPLGSATTPTLKTPWGEPDREPPLVWSHDPIHWLRLGAAGRMSDVPAVGNGDVAVHLGLHGIEVDDVIVFARDSLEHALLRVGEQRLAAVGPAVAVHHDEVGGRHTGDVCRVATNDRVRDLLIQAEDFGFNPVTIDGITPGLPVMTSLPGSDNVERGNSCAQYSGHD